MTADADGVLTQHTSTLFARYACPLQANYSTAKMGMFGLTQTLGKEARHAKKDIKVNCIAPLAGTRMLESVYPPELVKLLKVEHIVSLVLYLCHESNIQTGGMFECSGGACVMNRVPSRSIFVFV
jgi:NAD(P)-dependent dehydrogenase (short-subunit alcohol dehydrogenase family)